MLFASAYLVAAAVFLWMLVRVDHASRPAPRHFTIALVWPVLAVGVVWMLWREEWRPKRRAEPRRDVFWVTGKDGVQRRFDPPVSVWEAVARSQSD